MMGYFGIQGAFLRLIKLIFVVLMLVLLPSHTFAAGTWSHREVKHTSKIWIVEFTRDGTGEKRVAHFSMKSGDGSEQITRKKNNLELRWSCLNRFDIGEGSKEFLIAAMLSWNDRPFHCPGACMAALHICVDL